ncbi:phage tail protein (plasmid) [Salmonella enterica subsp. enterica serovar Typhi]|nr:phage tail protein [Salmonella enterica subsp. enterica serovar Typhi]
MTAKGITQLSSATNSTSEVLAATPKAVKAAYDRLTGSIQPEMQPRHKKG